MPEETNHARDCAKACLESILSDIDALNKAEETNEKVEYDNEQLDADQIKERLQESAYSVQVRSDWQTPGQTLEPNEFTIELAGGGPAVRIFGTLDEYNQPSHAYIEYQDWGTPWTEYFPEQSGWQNKLLTYCQCFWFGD